MRKIDIFEKARVLNQFVESSRKLNHTTFSGSELNESLKKLGFTTMMASAIANRCFPFEQVGKGRLYEVPKDPIHKSIIEELYDRQNSYSQKYHNKKKVNKEEEKSSSKPNVNEAWQTLVEAGIIKQKFNLQALKAKYPKIYLECMEYEIVK